MKVKKLASKVKVVQGNQLLFLMLGIIKPKEGRVLIDDNEYSHTSQVSRDFWLCSSR